MAKNVFTYYGTGWIKKANELGKFKNTYCSFRIYTIKECQVVTKVIEREGEKWNQTDFIDGKYVAIDKYGVKYEGKYWDVIAKIDIDILQQRFDKK